MATKRLIDANELMKAIKSFRWFGVPNTLNLMFDYLRIIPFIKYFGILHKMKTHTLNLGVGRV